MEVLYHGIKTRYAYDFPLCFPHELIMIWEVEVKLRPRPHVYVFILFQVMGPLCSTPGLEDTEQYKNARKTYTCGWGLNLPNIDVQSTSKVVGFYTVKCING